jgi:hypothetical protein
VASLVPAALFWVMVLAGSFHGLVAFGRLALGWRNGWEYLVPGTLDGVSVTFAMLAFRAVRRQKTPDRCYRVVWGAALASATINFAQEFGVSRNALAGGYVALLSLFGMVMFDEFLNQFEEGTASVRRENPKFGVRWLTWPSNTFLAAVAWRNHPPAEGTPGTVTNAIANLERVRAAKPARRDATRVERPAPAGKSRGVAGPAVPVVQFRSEGRSRSAPPPRRARRDRGGPAEAPVPVSSATVSAWAKMWMTMRASPDLAEAALKDDDAARQNFGVTSRQLRHVRYAVKTGALRRRAEELSMALPDGFTDSDFVDE